MKRETDEAFLERIFSPSRYLALTIAEQQRLEALARRGIEAEAKASRLEEHIRIMECCPDGKCNGSCKPTGDQDD